MFKTICNKCGGDLAEYSLRWDQLMVGPSGERIGLEAKPIFNGSTDDKSNHLCERCFNSLFLSVIAKPEPVTLGKETGVDSTDDLVRYNKICSALEITNHEQSTIIDSLRKELKEAQAAVADLKIRMGKDQKAMEVARVEFSKQLEKVRFDYVKEVDIARSNYESKLREELIKQERLLSQQWTIKLNEVKDNFYKTRGLN